MNIKSLIAGVLIAFFSLQSFAKDSTNAVVYTAAAQGDVVKLKEYLTADTNLISLRNGLLRTAAMNGQKDAVEFLISQGADVDEKGFIEMTPLAHMAMYGTKNDEKCAEVATVLLAHGAAIDPVDGYKVTPLLHAVESHKPRLVQVLLEHGADMNQRYKGWNSGMTPLHMAIWSAKGNKDMVAVLLKFKAPLDAVDQNGVTPLMLAEQQNKTEIAAMLRRANPSAAQSAPTYSVPPSKDAMREIAKRIAGGDAAAFAELANTSAKLYGEIGDFQKEQERRIILLRCMRAAFDVLGEEAGRGNDEAFQALKKSLGLTPLNSFAPNALGIAAAGGNKEALDILFNYQKWGMVESTAREALCAPTAANVEPAVDYCTSWLLSLQPYDRDSSDVRWATNALVSAANKGNKKAQEALEKFVATGSSQNN